MLHRLITAAVVLSILGTGTAPAIADVSLPSVVASHMVLQRDKPVKIWGWADAGEEVAVEVAGRSAKARANDRGEWLVTLEKLAAGGPHTLTVRGENEIVLTDILVGEVWIGSGQSNMQWSVNASDNAAAEIAAAKFPKLRLFLVPNVLSGIPNANVNASWKECSPASVRSFSAVLYFFGRHLHRELDVPVGLIASAWGGSRIEPWTPPPGFAGVPEVADITAQVRDAWLEYLPGVHAKAKALATPRPDVLKWVAAARDAAKRDALVPTAPADFEYPAHPLAGWPVPTSMFNAMIHPLVPYTVRGAIWYQGESNLADGMLYAHKKRALVEGWRKVWNDDSLSFYWAALAPFNYGGDPRRLPRIWEAQQLAMAVPKTGMAVITDIGNLGDIHPRNKQDVGKRLALWALAKDYGRDVVHSGPLFRSMKVEGSRARVAFDHVGGGLGSRDGKPLSWFEIAGDGDFVPAEAVIDGATVIVSSPQVKAPTAVRFGWSQSAEPNLQNKAGLQAGPFRTYSTPPSIRGKRLFVKATAAEVSCVESNGVIRYTVDGSTPSSDSAVYKGPVALRGTTTVKARFFRAGGLASAVTTATFEKVEPRRHDGKLLVPGVRYEYYEGEWDRLPDFDAMTAARSGRLDELGLGMRRKGDGFALRLSGWVEIATAGEHTFRLASDDGSKLTVDGKAVVDNDGTHGVVEKSGAVELAPGFHAIVVTFFERGGGEELLFEYEGPGVARRAVPLWCEE